MTELAQVCEHLSRENAELRGQIARLEAGPVADAAGPGAAPAPEAPVPATGQDWTISRRTVGKVLAGAAAGLVGTAAIADFGRTPARAAEPDTAEQATAGQPERVHPDDASGSASVFSASTSSASPVVAAANTGSGAGLRASSSAGRGGIFSGGAAQLTLSPSTHSSHPTSGQAGDLYVDSTGRLWFCKKTGSKATWHQVA